jgi:hypothetical protein
MHQNEIFTDILPDLIVTVAEMNIKEVKEQKGGGAPKLDSTAGGAKGDCYRVNKARRGGIQKRNVFLKGGGSQK